MTFIVVPSHLSPPATNIYLDNKTPPHVSNPIKRPFPKSSYFVSPSSNAREREDEEQMVHVAIGDIVHNRSNTLHRQFYANL